MKIHNGFPLQVAVIFAAGVAIAAIPLLSMGAHEVALAVLMGALLSTANAIAGFLALEYAIDKPHTTFLKVVLGGMGIRMVIALGLLVVLLKFAGLHAVGLTASVLGFYVVYLILEILHIQKRVSQTEKSS